jgi:hypothetical protein
MISTNYLCGQNADCKFWGAYNNPLALNPKTKIIGKQEVKGIKII